MDHRICIPPAALFPRKNARHELHENSFATNSTNSHENSWNSWPCFFGVFRVKFPGKIFARIGKSATGGHQTGHGKKRTENTEILLPRIQRIHTKIGEIRGQSF